MKKLVLAMALAASMGGAMTISSAHAAGTNQNSGLYKACLTLKKDGLKGSTMWKMLDCSQFHFPRG